MFVLYVLANPERQLYVGHTNNLTRRLQEHSMGLSRWTSARGPWILVHQESFETRAEAMKRERALKQGRLNQELRASLRTKFG